MKMILTAAIGLGVAALTMAIPAQAQVSIRAPGVAIDAGQQPYWREQHSDGEWRRQQEFKESQYHQKDWQRGHCVRDWDGKAFCR